MSKRLSLLTLAAAAMPLFGQGTTPVNISGIVTDSAGTPLSAAAVKLEATGLTATTGQDGRFSLTRGTTGILGGKAEAPLVALRDGSLFLSMAENALVTVKAYGLRGEELSTVQKNLDAGSRTMQLPGVASGVCFFRVSAGNYETVVSAFAMGGGARSATMSLRASPSNAETLAKKSATAAALYDVLTVTKSGYLKGYVSISNSDSADMKIKLLKEGSAKFSFFVTSLKSLLDLSKNANGFGGDFRFGETGQGAGLRGADKICATIAERSMPGSSVKGWRAFLSVTADASGKQVNAIDRVGPGPWYDRVGRVLAPTKADLLNTRPQNGDPTIQNDLPNEDGIPNHRPDPNKPEDDNHHMLTGSSETGTLKSATATCKDWTTSDGAAANGKPSCGFAWPRSVGGGGGGGGGGGSFGGSHWMSTWDAYGCAPGVQIVQTGPGSTSNTTVGEGGGYGGYYCFALNP